MNVEDFLAPIDRWKVPGLSVVFTDVDGTTGGMAAAARTPVRHRLTLRPR